MRIVTYHEEMVRTERDVFQAIQDHLDGNVIEELTDVDAAALRDIADDYWQVTRQFIALTQPLEVEE